MATYLLVDGHSLSFRAWFALQDTEMATASGQPTQAVYGFVSMVTRLIDDFRPDGIAVAFDRSEPTFRDELAPEYKAGRPPTPEPLRAQIGLIRQFVEVLGACAVDRVGYEADDVLGTLASRLSGGGHDVIIVTGDRDAFQLVADPHVRVLYNRRGVTDYVLYDEAGIFERTGVRPVDYPLFAAMRGDKSDNIPGVPGVGEKTAAKLVKDYGDLDALYAHLDALSPKLRQSLAEHEAQLRLNLALTPIVCDLPLEVTEGDLHFHGADRDRLVALFDLLELRTLKERLLSVLDALVGGPGVAAAPAGRAARPVVGTTDREAVLAYLRRLAVLPVGEPVAVVARFAGPPGRSLPSVIGLACAPSEAICAIDGGLLGDEEVVRSLVSLLGARDGPARPLYGHRTKELARALLSLGVDVRSLAVDTAVAAYLVDPALGGESLAGLAARFGLDGFAGAGDGAPAGRAAEQLGFALEADGEPALAGLGPDVELVSALGGRLAAELDAVGAARLWEEVERPLIRVLARMEFVGIRVDVGRLEAINGELTAEARRLEGEIHKQAGEVFNVNSPPQLRVVLYQTLGLRPGKRTKTGYSTDAQTLEKLRDQHPVIEALLEYREVEKLRSTYGTGLLAEVAADGRIHASFNQTVARTGRLSSDAPNLHNVPVRTDGGRRFREAFIPAVGCELLTADYNQIELRVIAHLSKDPGLVAAFAAGADIHAATAAGVFGVPVTEVTPAMRAKAKMVSYGLAYGMEAFGLAQRLAIGVDEAVEILDRYFAAFPSVRAYMDATVAEAKRRGYTETECGRRRYLPELSSDSFRVRQAAERQAMNAGIQGLAADIFKIALVRLDRALESAALASRIVLQVHDEIVVEVPRSEREVAEELTLDAMRNAYPLAVPLEVNLARGMSWAEAKSA